MTLRCVFGGCLLVCGLAQAQVNSAPKHCISPHDVIPKGTSYYSNGDPCPFNYRVPSGRLSQILKENPQCKGWGPAEVNCSRAVTGNYGQVQYGPGAPSAPNLAAQGPTRPDGEGHQVPYPETTLARMNFLPTRTAEEIWNMGGDFMERRQRQKAAATFLKCSQMGHVRCTSALGQMYDQGNGVPLDRARAVLYLKRGAEAGNRGAQYTYGIYFEEGEVIPRDIKKALEWYMKSAEQGFPEGERHIGFAYEFADLTLPHNRAKAIEWLSKAAAQGDGESAELVRVLRSPNTPAQFRDPDAFSAYYSSLFKVPFPAARSGGGGGGIRYDPYFDYNSQYWKDRNRVAPLSPK